MATLTILRGVSGSGKSTWAREQNAVVISRDSIRTALFGSESMHDESFVTAVEDSAIDAALKAGRDVIVDDTNIHWAYVKRFAAIGARHGATVEVKVFDVDLGTAVARNNFRADRGGRYVPIHVINKQHARFKANKSMILEPAIVPKPYEGTPGKPEAILVDLDGTLAHMGDRRKPYEWNKVSLDVLDNHVAEVVDLLSYLKNIIIMSGRSAECREDTIEWLDEHEVFYNVLIMREEGDNRPDNIVKAELFDKHVRDNYDVRFAIDDRYSVVRMWKQMGLKVFNVSGLDDGMF